MAQGLKHGGAQAYPILENGAHVDSAHMHTQCALVRALRAE